jgi:hypothetical protein
MVQMVMSLPRRYKENALILLTFSRPRDAVQDADCDKKKRSVCKQIRTFQLAEPETPVEKFYRLPLGPILYLF